MDFEYSFGRPAGEQGRPDPDDPFRMLVIGQFSGQGGVAPAQRKPIHIDIDCFDEVLARIAPRLSLEVGGAPQEIAFASLDDFHPDELYRRVAVFDGLRGLRTELRDPALYGRAAAALGVSLPGESPSEAQGTADESAGDIERLLGRKPTSPTAAQAATGGVNVDALLRDIVAPHVVPDTSDQQRELIAAADAAIAEQMRAILHHPDFQALEALWRGVDRLVRELETGETLKLYLLDWSRDDLLRDVAANAEDMSRSITQTLLAPAPGADGRRWSLLVLDQSFGPDAAELALLTLLASLAAKSGAPLLAGARPELLGCEDGAQLASAGAWCAADDAAMSAWNALRGSAVARWVGLALPRVLQRLPYGQATDPVNCFALEELAGGRRHQHYLWGSPALALALLAGRAFQEGGWEMALESQNELDDLPSHVFREDGEAHQQPGAELLMSEPAGEAALARGVMPLLSYRNRNAARLLRWQSIAEPVAPLAGI